MKIAVICAYYAQHLNTGMITVDLGAECFLKKLFGNDASISHFNVIEEYSVSSVIDYRLFDDPIKVLREHDYVFFWGDFLHSYNYFKYGSTIHALVQRKLGFSREKAEDFLFENLLLEKIPDEMLSKVVCFGGALHINSYKSKLSARYMSSISRLYSKCKIVSTRDPISQQYASFYSKSANAVSGIDGAFYLDHKRIFGNSFPFSFEKQYDFFDIGFSFNRSLKEDEDLFLGAKQLMNDILESYPVKYKGKVIDVEWFKGMRPDPIHSLQEKIKKIASCRLVVTDTYHMAINSLNAGVPAVLIGRGVDSRYDTLNDKKKEWLYRSLMLDDYYIYSEDLRSRSVVKKMAKNISSLANDQRHSYFWTSYLEKQKMNIFNKISGLLVNGEKPSSVDAAESKFAVLGEKKVDKSVFYKFSFVSTSLVELSLDLKRVSKNPAPKAIVLSLKVSGSPKEIPGFLVSENPEIGFYKYISMTDSRESLNIVVGQSSEFKVEGVKLIPWNQKDIICSCFSASPI